MEIYSVNLLKQRENFRIAGSGGRLYGMELQCTTVVQELCIDIILMANKLEHLRGKRGQILCCLHLTEGS